MKISIGKALKKTMPARMARMVSKTTSKRSPMAKPVGRAKMTLGMRQAARKLLKSK